MGALVALLVWASSAHGDVPVLYHSPLDDGVPSASPVEGAPGTSLTLYLYLDGGSDPSEGIRCSNGSGDEVCFWNVALQATGTATITSFTSSPDIVHHLSGSTIRINGGDPWRGDLGPQRIGELILSGGAQGGGLDLSTGQAVDSSLGVVDLAPAVVVPEPAVGISMGAGALLLAVLGRCRPGRRGAGRVRHAASRRRGAGRVRHAASRRRSTSMAFWLAASLAPLSALAPGAHAQTSIDCGDVVSDGVIDAADLDAIRGFLAGAPAAPDLQGDPQALARCDVSGNGACDVGDYARVRRYLIGLSGGMDETCPLIGATFAPAVLAPPVVDQGPSLATDRSSVVLSGEADPGDLIRVEGAPGLPTTAADGDGTWELEVPLALDGSNALDVRRDFGGGVKSDATQLLVTQTDPTGEGSIEGIVVDASSPSTPIAGAIVSAHGITTSSDPFGRFRIEGLPEGRLIVRTERTGYVPSAVLVETDTTTFGPGADEANLGATISLVPAAPTQVVGSGGGVIATASGFELIVPAGSLATDTPIAVTESGAAGASGFDGVPTVDIGPGPITFDPPAILRVPMSGFAPGQPADFLQIDQGAGAVTPRVGLTGGSGFVELEIHSSSGDEILTRLRAYKDEATFPNGGGGVPIDNGIAFNNCDGETPAQTISGRRDAVVFTGDPFSGADPILRTRLENNPRSLAGLAGLLKASSSADQTAFIPPGTIGVVNVTGVEITVEQPIYVFRFPEAGGSATRNRLGILRYRVTVPESAVLTEVFECPRPTSAAWGDPHLIRFDHVGEAIPSSSGDGRYDFQASGEFVLFESTQDDMVVQSRFEPLPANQNVTITTATAMDVMSDRVMVDMSGGLLRVRVDAVETSLSVGVPLALPGGGELERLSSPNSQDRLVVRWPDGSIVTITLLSFMGSEYLNIYPDLAPQRGAKVQGLLGNANGILGDDLNLRDGTPADPAGLYSTYADSWRISQAESLFDYEAGEDTSTYNGTPPDPDYGLDDLDLAVRDAAEATCLAAGISEDPLLGQCTLDVALLGGGATGSALDTLDQVPDSGTYVAVSGQASVFQAGRSSVVDLGGGGGAGLLPAELPLPAGTNRVVRVLDRAGAVVFSSSGGALPPDGVEFTELTWGDWNGLAGPELRRMGPTLGVFLEDTLPVEAPESFAYGDIDGVTAAPEIGQIFCLGDGLSAANEPQTFFVPDAATRLFLGFADRLSSQMLESEVHHLGDDFGTNGLFALAPDPEGLSWTSDPFAVPTAFAPSSARVIVDLAETNSSQNSIRVNGQHVASLPNTGTNTGVWTEDVEFGVDPALLMPSGNVVEIRSSGSNLDDFLFRDLRFEFIPPFASLPGSASPAPMHIGDDTGSDGLFSLDPEPTGTFWQGALFGVSSPESLADARVLLDLAQTDFNGNEVLVNGGHAGFLPIRTSGTQWSAIVLPFDPSLLRALGNQITIRSTTSGGLNYDDFMIQNVRIEAASFEDAPPGGYSDNTGVHEFIIEVSP